MKIVVLLSILFLLVSCSTSIEGTFVVERDMDFAKQNKNIPLGEYDATLIIYKSKKVKFIVKNIHGEERKFKFKIPEDLDFPTNTGEIFLFSNDIGQEFDLRAKVNSDTSNSEEQSNIEGCTYQDYRQVCGTECHSGPDGHPVCAEVCRWRDVTVHGSKQVTFYFSYTNTFYDVAFLEKLGRQRLAIFTAKDNETKKHYTYIGNCY